MMFTLRYQLKEHEAEALESFILPMLDYYPLKRATAQESLRHHWLKMPPELDCKMTENEFNELLAKRQANQEEDETQEHPKYVETEDNDADDDLEESDLEDDNEANDTWYTEGHDNYGYKHLMNKSFDNGTYTGYAGGIVVDELDREANWQFKHHKQL